MPSMLRRPWVTDIGFVLLLGLAMFGFSLASPSIPGGDDAYRHVRFANRLVTETQAALADPWRLAYLWPKPVDVWFGYHLLLAPFTLFLPLIVAAKLVGSGVWAASVYAILRLLDSLGIVWRHAWVILGVAGSGIVLYRAMLMRPFLLSLLLMILAARYTLEEKPVWLGIVSGLHAFSYSIFFFVGLPPLVYFLVRRSTRSFQLGVASAVGMAVGLSANPFFPENLKFSIATALTRAGADVAVQLKAGGEVLPISGWWLAASIPVLGAWGIAIVVMVARWKRQRPSPAQWLFFGISLAALLVSFRAARMFDYFVPFAAVMAGAVLGPLIPRNREKSAYAFGFAYLLCAASLVPALATVRSAPSVDRYRGASEFLARQGGDGLVMNTAWQQYVFLYYWNPKSRYLTGMEPGLFYNLDRERYWLWRKLSDDLADEAGVMAAFRDFGGTYLLVDRRGTPKLGELMEGMVGVGEVFRDGEMSVFVRR
ncbi:MAG: hypothetical protein ABI995_02865 [Acidobacteriota bacterium]